MTDLTPPQREPWMDDALCAQIGGDLWYPEPGDHGTAQAAKAACRRCEVTAECLDYALANNEWFGVWGGLTREERRRMPHGRRVA